MPTLFIQRVLILALRQRSKKFRSDIAWAFSMMKPRAFVIGIYQILTSLNLGAMCVHLMALLQLFSL